MQEEQDNSQEIPQSDKHIVKLAQAIERTYGNAGKLMWRSFLSGFMRSFGVVVGYVLFMGIAILIARKLGVFEAAQEFWNNTIGSLPFNQIKEMQIDPELLKQFQNQGS